MSGTWSIPGAPHSVRPETHWLYEVMGHGEKVPLLWFSLQLKPTNAKALRDAFTTGEPAGVFDRLIDAGARMSKASHAALSLALAAVKDGRLKSDTIGTDILVPQDAFGKKSGCSPPPAPLQECVDARCFEITDAGLAIDDETGGTAPKLPLLKYPKYIPEAQPARSDPEYDPSKPMIIAIIDDGVGIANRRFRKSDTETRVANFLDLGSYDPNSKDELLARSWTKSDIDKLLTQYKGDEEQVYRAMGLIGRNNRRQPLRAAASHGTHMLDTAAGYDYTKNPKEAENRHIIAVQLPSQVPRDRSDAWLPQSLKRALDFILVKADELSETLGGVRVPLIVDCSIGSMAGPKDGQSDLERRIAQFVETYDERLCKVVLSAGNYLLTRAAARVSSPGNVGNPLCWRLQPDDKTPSFVQIWGPPVDSHEPQIVVTLKLPRATATLSSTDKKPIDWQDPNGKVCARLYRQILKRPDGKWRECVTVAVRPTAEDGETEAVPLMPFGACGIEIRTPNEWKGDLAKDIHLRIHRDDPGMFVRGKGRQSYFDDRDYVRFDPRTGATASDETVEDTNRKAGEVVSPVTMQDTLSAYSYSKGVLVVGGYRRSDGKPVGYSSAGSADDSRKALAAFGADRTGPDLAAVTEESPALWGILATGTYTGSVEYLNGTSVAAPLAVRALADVGGSVPKLRARIEEFEATPRGPQKKLYEPKGDRPLRLGNGRLEFRSDYKMRITDYDAPPDTGAGQD